MPYLSLLVRAGDSSPLHRRRERAGAAADLAVHDVILEGLACLDGAVDQVLADVVDGARDLADLEASSSQRWRSQRGKKECMTSGMMATNAVDGLNHQEGGYSDEEQVLGRRVE